MTFTLHQDLIIFIMIPIVLFNNSYPIVRMKIQIITKTISVYRVLTFGFLSIGSYFCQAFRQRVSDVEESIL